MSFCSYQFEHPRFALFFSNGKTSLNCWTSTTSISRCVFKFRLEDWQVKTLVTWVKLQTGIKFVANPHDIHTVVLSLTHYLACWQLAISCTNTNYTEGNQSVVDMIKMAKMLSYVIWLMVAGASNISVIELYMDVYIYIYIYFITSVLGMCVPLCLLLYFWLFL